MVQVGSQKSRKMFSNFLLSYLTCSLFWLDISVNHCYFDYNTKLLEKTLMHMVAQSLNNGQKYSHQCPQVQAQDNPHCVVSTSCTHGSQQE